jgi:ribosome-interacting GTPase 1
VTKTKSEVAAYSFTTLTAIPGVLEYGGAEIQVLDLPGIIEGASEGKGRGRQVISAAKVSPNDSMLPLRNCQLIDVSQTSDMVLMVLDATKRAEQRALLEAELEAVGIRLNQDPPNIYLKPKTAGGMKITFASPPKNLDEKMLYNILRDYRMLNCEVLVRDENGKPIVMLVNSNPALVRSASNCLLFYPILTIGFPSQPRSTNSSMSS